MYTACASGIEHVRIVDTYYTEKILGNADYYKQGRYRHEQHQRFYHTRYLVRPSGDTADARIINKAVDHMLNGDYSDARILLERLSSSYSGAVPNNPGVVYEILGEKERALHSYFKACRDDPANRYYIRNFNSL